MGRCFDVEKSVQVFARTVEGSTAVLRLHRGACEADVMAALEARTGIPAHCVRVARQGGARREAVLEDGETVHVVGRLSCRELDETVQVFARTLAGSTAVLRLPPGACEADVRAALETRTGIPARCVRVVRQGGAGALEDGETVHVVGRLCGAKGGFGAQLKASRAGHQTTNFDAMRDLSGRRLRTAEQDRRLEAWRAQEEDRRLEAAAEAHIQSEARRQAREEQERVDIEGHHRALDDAGERIASAVRDGIAQRRLAAASAGPSNASAPASAAPRLSSEAAGPSSGAATAAPARKRPGAFFGDPLAGDSDSESEDGASDGSAGDGPAAASSGAPTKRAKHAPC